MKIGFKTVLPLAYLSLAIQTNSSLASADNPSYLFIDNVSPNLAVVRVDGIDKEIKPNSGLLFSCYVEQLVEVIHDEKLQYVLCGEEVVLR
ncbi:hypothetical protein DS2_00065 [Catenovulum agarivorans DS-2]|uniref:Uncharacterized protein n=1 Tax=Catenovulum agarivorans DS-2 TaxID=1328313 RepID=W7QJM7_9ALTE|nr:hypothetical protein [Catenovulum agarivorans]EWH12071.1 hypothetical protein DS2_00065 [Catenovulum agarivorans DS-2]